jgi:peptide/nickel transport system ATP-binding protein
LVEQGKVSYNLLGIQNQIQEAVTLDIEHLDIEYMTRNLKVHAVRDFGLALHNGESVGLLGESGAGKSTVGWAILGMITKPNIATGQILVDGENVLRMNETELKDYRWRKAAMIFQASMNTLDPVTTIGTSFVDLLKSKKVSSSKKEAIHLTKQSLELVELDPSLIDAYPHQLSGGMKERVAIAMAIIINPRILIADEPTTALDTLTQSSILKLLKALRKESKIQSILFISHDIAVHAYMTDRLIIMFRGRQIEEGITKDVIANPQHPYTKLLIGSIRIGGQKEKSVLRGDASIASLPEDSCPYVPFCPYAMKICSEKFPKSVFTAESHKVACFLYGGE